MMRFKDRTADPQSHAGAVRFGGKKRVEDLVRVLRAQTQAGIADRDQHVTILTALRLKRELAGLEKRLFVSASALRGYSTNLFSIP
jgi:hypothetical protein